MKNSHYIFAAVVILILTIVVIKGPRSERLPVVGDTEIPAVVDSTQLCFIWNTEAGDLALLSMDLQGEDVMGEFYFLPAEKDRKVGIYQGKVSAVDDMTMSRTIDAFWQAEAEGTQAIEELRIIFGEGTANPGFGEMKDRGDGVYVYADPANISYALNLQETDCGDEILD